jgi:hypothetical protein
VAEHGPQLAVVKWNAGVFGPKEFLLVFVWFTLLSLPLSGVATTLENFLRSVFLLGGSPKATRRHEIMEKQSCSTTTAWIAPRVQSSSRQLHGCGAFHSPYR